MTHALPVCHPGVSLMYLLFFSLSVYNNAVLVDQGSIRYFSQHCEEGTASCEGTEITCWLQS